MAMPGVEPHHSLGTKSQDTHTAAPSSSSLVDSDQQPRSKSVDLKLIAYDRSLHPVTGNVNPFHWLLFAATGPGVSGTVYQLRGMPGNFHYPGPEKHLDPNDVELSSQEVEIGRIPFNLVHHMEDIIRNVTVSKAEHDFNCQNWTEDVMHRLADKGWLDVSPSAVVKWFQALESQST